jgi:hypothetical protein
LTTPSREEKERERGEEEDKVPLPPDDKGQSRQQGKERKEREREGKKGRKERKKEKTSICDISAAAAIELSEQRAQNGEEQLFWGARAIDYANEQSILDPFKICYRTPHPQCNHSLVGQMD